MTKYSVNSNSSSNRSEEELSNGGTCELCGEEVDSLHLATIEGATLEVCKECYPQENGGQNSQDETTESTNRTKDVINRTTVNAENALPDSSWAVEGVGYDSEPLPYLVSDYGDIVEEAREEQGLTQEELAEEINVGLDIIRVIEQGQAASRDVGGDIIENLEEVLGVQLEEE